MYIVLAVRFFGSVTSDLLIIWGSALAAIWGPLAITSELKVVYNYNPIFVLLLPILVILMVTIGLTLFLVPDRFFNIYVQYNINYKSSPSYYHNVRFNFLAIILLISYSLPKLLAVVYLVSYYNKVLYFLAYAFSIVFLFLIFKSIKEPSIKKFDVMEIFQRNHSKRYMVALPFIIFYINEINIMSLGSFILYYNDKSAHSFFIIFILAALIVTVIITLTMVAIILFNYLKNHKGKNKYSPSILERVITVAFKKKGDSRVGKQTTKPRRGLMNKIRTINFKILRAAKILLIISFLVFPSELIGWFSVFPYLIPSNWNYSDAFGLNAFDERNITITQVTVYSNGTFSLSFIINIRYKNIMSNVTTGSILFNNKIYTDDCLVYPPLMIKRLFFDLNGDYYSDISARICNGTFLLAPSKALGDDYSNGTTILYSRPGLYILTGIATSITFTTENNTFALAIGYNLIFSNFFPVKVEN